MFLRNLVHRKQKHENMKTIKVRTVLVWLTLLMLTAGSSKSMIIGVHKKGIITGLVSNFETNQPFAFVSVESIFCGRFCAGCRDFNRPRRTIYHFDARFG